MSFSTIPFVFLFLPVSLLLYVITPRRAKPLLLLVLSLLFYAWGDAGHLPALVASILFNYFGVLEIDRWFRSGYDGRARTALYTTVGANVLFLCFYKYFAGTMPLGVSFFTFSALSYVFDVYYDTAPAEPNIIRAALYMAFFPKLISGPIVQYGDFFDQLEAFQLTKSDLFAGTELFLIGLFKKVLLADRLGAAFAAVQAMGGGMAAGTAWLGMIFYSLQLYFDFSGYSDMAIGLSRMLGFHFDKNFDYPYRSLNVSEFWRRWHISLGAWFRTYVYIPLGGNRCGSGRQLFNLAAVWLLTGIWHGSTLNFVFWGLYHGLFVALERFVIRDRFDGVPRALRSLATCLVVFVGWVFFFSGSLGGAFGYIGEMLGADGMGFWNGATSYLFRTNFLLLAAAVVGSGPVAHTLRENIVARYPTRAMTISVAIFAVLLIFSIAGMVNATYSTFLYFQF